MVDQSRRNLLIRLGTGALIVVVGGVAYYLGYSGRPAAPTQVTTASTTGIPMSNELTVGIWGGGYWDAQLACVAGPYSDKTGVKITPRLGGQSARMVIMRAEKPNWSMDVYFGGPSGEAVLQNEMNAFIPIAEKESLIPNLKDSVFYPMNEKIWTNFLIPPWAVGMGLVARTDLLPDWKQIKSWKDILDPKYKGKVGWPTIEFGPGLGIVWMAAFLADPPTGTFESGQPDNIDAAWDILRKYKDHFVFYPDDPTAENMITRGEVAIAPRTTQETYAWKDQGLPVEILLDLKEGVCHLTDSASMIRHPNAPDKENRAADYINYLMGTEAQERLAEYYFAPVNRNVSLPPSLKSKLPTPDEIGKWNHNDEIWIAQNVDSWTEQWNKILAGG